MIAVFRPLLDLSYAIFNGLANLLSELSSSLGPVTNPNILGIVEKLAQIVRDLNENGYEGFNNGINNLKSFTDDLLEGLSAFLSALISMLEGGGVNPVADSIKNLLVTVLGYLVSTLVQNVEIVIKTLKDLVRDLIM